jgi:hypothetical protein
VKGTLGNCETPSCGLIGVLETYSGSKGLRKEGDPKRIIR